MSAIDLIGIDTLTGRSRRSEPGFSVNIPIEALVNVSTSSLSPDDVLQWNGSNWENRVLRSNNVSAVFTKTEHGFSVLDPLKIGSSGWELGESPNVLAVVEEVIDSNNFLVVFAGLVEVSSHGLTVGSVYYAPETAGALVDQEPNTTSQPVLTVVDANHVLVKILRGTDKAPVEYISSEISAQNFLTSNNKPLLTVPTGFKFKADSIALIPTSISGLTQVGNFSLFYNTDTPVYLINTEDLSLYEPNPTINTFWEFTFNLSGLLIPENEQVFVSFSGFSATSFEGSILISGRLL